MKKLLVGLGNPGELYKNQRHNVGFFFLDYFIKAWQSSSIANQSKDYSFIKKPNLKSELVIIDDNMVLLKPQTYMNLSGVAVTKTILFLSHIYRLCQCYS